MHTPVLWDRLQHFNSRNSLIMTGKPLTLRLVHVLLGREFPIIVQNGSATIIYYADAFSGS